MPALTALNMVGWITRQITRMYNEGSEGEVIEGYRVTQFELVHVRVGNLDGDEVHTIPTGSKQYSAKELADTFEQLAITHANGFSGTQTFVLRARFADASVEPAKFPFRKAGQLMQEGLGTEEPNMTGHMAQMMRHNEALMRISTNNSEAMLGRMAAMVERLMSHNEDLMTQNARAFEAVKEMRIESVEREYGKQKELLEFQRKTQERQKIFALLPGFINKIAGAKVLPEGGMAEIAIQQLRSTITPQQVEQLMSILTPDQIAVVAPMLMSEGEPQTAEQTSENGNANPNG